MRLYLCILICCAIAQAVSDWIPTAARVRSCGICGGQSGTGAGCLWVLQFPLPIFIPPIAPQSPSSIIWDWYSRPVSGRSTKWTQSHPTKEKKVRTGRPRSRGSNVGRGRRSYSSTRHLYRLSNPPSLLSKRYRRVKLPEAWSWPSTSVKCDAEQHWSCGSWCLRKQRETVTFTLPLPLIVLWSYAL
jgi:hypothetical protein